MGRMLSHLKSVEDKAPCAVPVKTMQKMKTGIPSETGEELRSCGGGIHLQPGERALNVTSSQTRQITHETTFVETISSRPPAAYQNPLFGHRCGASLKCHLQLATKAEDPSFLILLDVGLGLQICFGNGLEALHNQNSNDTEPSDDVSESNQKTCIKMKGLTNEK
ncbi:hypothetical protein llap_8238 [Limosa lapponica baueri]|uniref:Uncharacterized protein n=1 Tax=Limosa lapponica baueri TaxID=1758121 RepID=A0A2I0U622_LIMLA|nr:hypothetical protein llap_8238 [Limosa lapponica baueri]